MIYLKKIWKYQIFPIFFSKLMLTSCLCLLISQICAKEFQNWVHLCVGEVLKLKLIKGEVIISNGLEMADTYLLGGVAATPPTLVRVKFWSLTSRMFQNICAQNSAVATLIWVSLVSWNPWIFWYWFQNPDFWNCNHRIQKILELMDEWDIESPFLETKELKS